MKVHDEDVRPAEHRPRRRGTRAVETEHGQARRRVTRRPDARMVLRRSPESVLRCQEPHQPHAPQVAEQRGRVSVARVDRGLMGEERHAAALEECLLVVDEDLEPASDGGHPPDSSSMRA